MPGEMTRKLGRALRFLGLGDLSYAGKWVGLSALIGFVGGWAAVGFDLLTHAIQKRALTGLAGFEGEGVAGHVGSFWWVLAIPTLGGLVVGWLIQRFAPEAEGHGTEQLIKTFHHLNGVVRPRVVAIKAIASAITIGTGGSAGQEGPVAQIGSGVGSTAATALKLADRDRRIFLLTGATAGVGALFTAPLGGALFAPEVLYRKAEFEGDAIIPCIVSSIVAYTTFTFVTGKTRAIPIDAETLDGLSFSDPRELLVYIVLGLLCTLVGWVYVRFFHGMQKAFDALKPIPKPVRPAIGGFLVGALALAIAPLCGGHGVLFGGYELMKGSIAGSLALETLCILIVAKIAATSFSIASGGSGGVFAPSLAIGALLGGLVGQAAVEIFPSINPATFALVGMGGFFAGVAKVPITSILMVCEMTGNYQLLAPLMLVSVVHLVLSRRWSIYETQVQGQVDSPAHAGDFVVDVLERMQVGDVISEGREPVLVSGNTTMRKALEIVSTELGSYFPVVDEEERMIGIFSLSDIRRIFREVGVEDLVIVRDFMVENVARVTPNDTLDDALRLLNEFSIAELPVVSSEDDRRVIAMLSRNNLGAAYHRRLRDLKRGSA